jgi:hypothetical protein
MRTESEQKRYEYKKAWAKANAEKVRASRKKYEENNKELVDAYRNSDAFKKRAIERATAYNKKNKEKRKTTTSKYAKNHPHKILMNVMKRNAKKLQATPKWADETKIACLYSVAAMLNKYGTEKYHIDHIVPLRSKIVCGLHTYENLRVITAKENLQKSNKHQP